MSQTDQPVAESPASTCGNCGVAVRAADITCPACGVLLAAYQAPAGAIGNETISTAPVQPAGDASATREVATPAMTVTPPLSMTAPAPEPPTNRPPPPRHQPRSQSPIGDALRRSRDARDARATGADDFGSAEIADELARMATSDSALAREVEAELTGARVTFDGATPVIETDQVDITHDAEGAPVVAVHESAAPLPKSGSPVSESRGRADAVPATRPQPVRPSARATSASDAGAVRSTPTPVAAPGPPPATTRPFDPATLVRWIPFILIGCVILGVGRSLPGFGGVIGLALVIGLIYLLVKVAAASSRKTTSMPRDDSWNSKRPRWRK